MANSEGGIRTIKQAIITWLLGPESEPSGDQAEVGTPPGIRGGKLVRSILVLQPVFTVPVFVSVLAGTPPLWLAGIIAFIPLAVRFWLARRFLPRTPFDVPILLLAVGLVVGLAVAADKSVAISALATTLASALIYYGMVGNGWLADRYWAVAGGVVCAIALVLVLLFFSEAPHRVVPYNAWVFPLFQSLPKTGWPVLGFNSIGVLLSVLLPPLCAIALFRSSFGLRVGAAVLAGVFLLALVLTASGGGLIATACGLAFVLVCWRRWMAFVVVPAFGAGAALVALLYTKVSWVAQVFSTTSVSTRLTFWEDTLHRLNGWGIVTGLGLGSWPDRHAWAFGWAPEHPHNSYLQVYSDTGLLGGGGHRCCRRRLRRAGAENAPGRREASVVGAGRRPTVAGAGRRPHRRGGRRGGFRPL